ncbi:MAG: hypothetical protein XXXNARYT_003806 [Candidatus Accumulibacter regalis]
MLRSRCPAPLPLRPCVLLLFSAEKPDAWRCANWTWRHRKRGENYFWLPRRLLAMPQAKSMLPYWRSWLSAARTFRPKVHRTPLTMVSPHGAWDSIRPRTWLAPQPGSHRRITSYLSPSRILIRESTSFPQKSESWRCAPYLLIERSTKARTMAQLIEPSAVMTQSPVSTACKQSRSNKTDPRSPIPVAFHTAKASTS